MRYAIARAAAKSDSMADSDFDPIPGAAEQPEPGIRRILAPNPRP